MYIDKKTFSMHTTFFHDGSLFSIEHERSLGELTLIMESAEIDPEELKKPILLSKGDRIRGKLHLKGVKSISVDGELLASPLCKKYDDGEIKNLEIKDTEVLLHIIWTNYPPKEDVYEFSTIVINASDIYWENIPDMAT